MKIKSFTAKTESGPSASLESAFRNLDDQVTQKLGDKVIIHDVKDTPYIGKNVSNYNKMIVRVVVYSEE